MFSGTHLVKRAPDADLLPQTGFGARGRGVRKWMQERERITDWRLLRWEEFEENSHS